MAALRIVNTYDQLTAAGGDVCAIVTAYLPGRGTSAYGWAIYRVVNGRSTASDSSAAWYDNGCKTFSWSVYGGDKKAAMAAAREFVKSLNGYDGPWTRNRMWDYVPTAINKRFPIPKRQK